MQPMSLSGYQTGRISLKVGIIVLIVAVVLAVVLERVLIPMFQQPVEEPSREFSRFEAISAMDEAQLQHWDGTLRCDALGNNAAFERSRDVVIGDNIVALERGDTEAFLASTDGGSMVPHELEERFEWWRGLVRGTQVELEGWYTEGSDTIKRIGMTGELVGDSLTLEGERGPRNCRYEASPAQGE